MLTEKSLEAYREQFHTNGCMFAEPGCNLMVKDAATGKAYISPCDETDEIFADRLERCKLENRNLFFKEWKELVYEPGIMY